MLATLYLLPLSFSRNQTGGGGPTSGGSSTELNKKATFY